MQTKFQVEGFEPNHLKNAKRILEKGIQVAQDDSKVNQLLYIKESGKTSLWQRLLNFFKS